ncbi:ferric reductase-like transmembrane domain-containing protein [Yangia mangrovi]|uniref:Ferric reductase-like transmembrane domain-containing protein n=1 Tax=Alloyangia mangrovi TaxID=1779329 RepID=A0A2A3JWD5_9RHOB|nr:ferric reductase-like transmembrane domain-containing protein [Alloyangia mangrovi]MCT4371845.1 ferric reductase-like transmembrane domain-containing protein [Alloyangia mangrovi]
MPPTPPKRRGLPPLVLALCYAALISLPLLPALLTGQGHGQAAMRLATGAGVAAAAMILLQMITSGRFEAISGRIGIDITMAFHKWAAPVALLLALVHVLAVIGLPDPDRPGRLSRRVELVLSGPGLWEARLALILLAVLVVLALLRDRLGMRYQIWRAGHALGAVTLVALIAWHAVEDGRAGALAAAVWILFALGVTLPALWVYAVRLVRPAGQGWTLREARPAGERLWLLRVAPPEGGDLCFEPGQFAWVAFGRKRLPLHDHPFSIASAPGEAELRFLVQEAGDFTNGVGQLAPGTRVSVDAPHGSFVPRGEGPLVLVAGGVGVAPILSILSHLAQSRSRRPVRFLYAARSAEAMVPPDLYRPACAALGVVPMLVSDRAEQGGALLRGPLTRAHLAEAFEGLDPANCEVMTCGPGPMMTFVADMVLKMGVPMQAISYERFSYAAGRASAKDRRILSGFAALWSGVAALVLIYWLA